MTARVETLAVVDHVGNHGGGSRFLRALLPALRFVRPELEITLFGNAASLRRDGLLAEFRDAGITVRALQSVRLRTERLLGIPGTTVLAERVQRRTSDRFRRLPPILSGNVQAELERLVRGFDLAYFAWPYGLRPPRLRCPLVATVHDLNFKYFFGSVVWSRAELSVLDDQVSSWLHRARIVTSSAFMAREIAHFYPGTASSSVVRLAPFAGLAPMSDDTARAHVERMGIQAPYVLYPTHLITHKNVGPLIASMAILRAEFPDLKLVLTGAGTDIATGRATAIGSERGAQPTDVVGLGYVTNAEMDALIVRAAVVTSPSLYEAGNGPGVDAWRFGVPVAMSDIAPFREHLDVLGVWAEVFDPRQPSDIARSIASILRNPDEARVRARASATAMATQTWPVTAEGYLGVFDSALSAVADVRLNAPREAQRRGLA